MADRLLIANNSTSTLAASISTIDTIVTVQSGQGDRFPQPQAGEYFKITMGDVIGNIEVAHCIARANDTLTLLRGQEGTTPFAFAAGDRIETRITAGTIEALLQVAGGTMQGDINLNSNALSNGSNIAAVSFDADVMRAKKYRAKDGNTGNQLDIPDGGGDATIGNYKVWTANNLDPTNFVPKGAIIMWSGALNDIPTGWALCDGSGGTPNLTDRFIVAAGDIYEQNTRSGQSPANFERNTQSGGAHDHGGKTASKVLNKADMPAHSHHIFASAGGSDDYPPDGNDAVKYGNTGAGENSYQIVGLPGSGSAEAQFGVTSEAGSNDGHAHDIVSHSGHQHVYDTRPSWYALAYIIKTADTAVP